MNEQVDMLNGSNAWAGESQILQGTGDVAVVDGIINMVYNTKIFELVSTGVLQGLFSDISAPRGFQECSDLERDAKPILVCRT